jgi:hypothetical protein
MEAEDFIYSVAIFEIRFGSFVKVRPKGNANIGGYLSSRNRVKCVPLADLNVPGIIGSDLRKRESYVRVDIHVGSCSWTVFLLTQLSPAGGPRLRLRDFVESSLSQTRLCGLENGRYAVPRDLKKHDG